MLLLDAHEVGLDQHARMKVSGDAALDALLPDLSGRLARLKPTNDQNWFRTHRSIL